MIATKMRTSTTPPTTPPMTGAKGNLSPPPFGSVCITPGEEDGPLDEDVEELEVVVVVVIPGWVEDWGAKG